MTILKTGYRHDERDKQREKDTCERNLRTLMSARNDRIRRFGAWVPSALAKVDEWHRQHKFHKKPRGPLGKMRRVVLCYWELGHLAWFSACCPLTVAHETQILNWI